MGLDVREQNQEIQGSKSMVTKKQTKYPGALQCLGCGVVLVSFHRHDFKTCSCKNETFIDGGCDYLRCGGKDLNKIQVLKLSKVKKK